jgi:hypothetical protein
MRTRRFPSRLFSPGATAVMLAAACGGSSGKGGNVTPTGSHFHYVVNSVTAPTSQSSDDILHVDANGNPVATGGAGVNKLGGLFATLKQAGNINIQTPLTQAVDDGSIILLADLQTTNFTNAPGAGFQMFIGSDPNPPACLGSSDTTCGQQFSGSASFSVESDSGDTALAGPIVAGELNAGPGDITIEFTLSTGGSGGNLMINLKDALVQATMIGSGAIGVAPVGSDGSATGGIVLGGAILETDIDSMLIPTVATELNATVSAECTAGSGSAGATCGSGLNVVSCPGATAPMPTTLCCTGDAGEIVGANSVVGLDANKDCVITAAELQSNTLVSSLLSPDVASTGNGKPDAVSFGIGATAVSGEFTVAGE